MSERREEQRDGLVYAPFSFEQVRGLRAWQSAGHVHPFTCANGHGALEVDRGGWYCQTCGYEQGWAHHFMVHGPPPNPLDELFSTPPVAP